MDFKILSAVDFHKNELKNPVAQNLGTAPGTPVAGLFYMDTTVSDARMRYYNGSTWVDLYQPITDVDGAGAISVGIASGVATVSFSPAADVAFNSHKITGLADPTNPQDAATKGYVDAVSLGLDVKTSVRAATTVNITLSGTQTIDGVALVAGNRVLVKNQTTTSQNGLYEVAAGAWTRTPDGTNGNLNSGAFVFVEEGSTLDDTGWVLSTANPITVGTTGIAWAQFSGAGTGAEAGDGLLKTGNVFDVVGTADRITVGAAVDIASTYVGQSSITTLGTIATGTWNATTIAVNKGGTGITSYTTGNYINASGATTLQQRTPAQVLSDIGAAASGHNHTLDSLSNVTITTNTTGELLKWSGTAWINNTLAEAGIAAASHAHIISDVTGLQTALDGKVDENAAITAGTATKITYDAKGLVTAGTTLVANDIPNLDAAKITTGTLAVARGGTGLASYTAGNYIYASGTTTLSERTPTQVRTDLSINNVENTALSTWAGSTSITTLGTVTTGTWTATDVAVLHGGTGSSTAAGARTNLGAAGVYRTAIGTGAATSIVVTHNLNNRFVTVNVWETGSPYSHVHCGIEATTVNTTTLYFSTAPTTGQYTVVVTG